ncbi:MAG: SET domain-containing protein-lysine N-methyltransferase [Stellaceae bacterium]
MVVGCLEPAASNPLIEIHSSHSGGRGVFARQAIPVYTVIETAPVVIVPARECAALDRTILHDYYFHWDGDPAGDGRGAVALGLVSLCNHSSAPRARANRNFAAETLDLIALVEIERGAEITIDYNCELWFEPRV